MIILIKSTKYGGYLRKINMFTNENGYHQTIDDSTLMFFNRFEAEWFVKQRNLTDCCLVEITDDLKIKEWNVVEKFKVRESDEKNKQEDNSITDYLIRNSSNEMQDVLKTIKESQKDVDDATK